MRVHWILSAILSGTPFVAPSPDPSACISRPARSEVVYNELHDHQLHGYWRYWIEKQAQKQTKLESKWRPPTGRSRSWFRPAGAR